MKSSIKSWIVRTSLAIAVVIPATLLFSGVASAQALSSAELQLFQSLLARYQQEQAATTTPGAFCFNFNGNFGVGTNNGAAVTALHTALTKEGFTTSDSSSTYGESTASAVTGFQQKYASTILTPNGLSYGTGYVGAATRAELNTLYGCNGNTPTTQPVIQPVTVTPTTTTVISTQSSSPVISSNNDSNAIFDVLISSPQNSGSTWQLSSNQNIEWAYPAAVAGKTLHLTVLLVNSTLSSWPITNQTVTTSSNVSQLNAEVPWSDLSRMNPTNLPPAGSYFIQVNVLDPSTGIVHTGNSGEFTIGNVTTISQGTISVGYLGGGTFTPGQSIPVSINNPVAGATYSVVLNEQVKIVGQTYTLGSIQGQATDLQKASFTIPSNAVPDTYNVEVIQTTSPFGQCPTQGCAIGNSASFTITSTSNIAGAPSCVLTSDKSSYTLGDTITLSWTSQNATYASWQQDTSGKDHLNLPGDKLAASGSQQVIANVIGNPSITLNIASPSGSSSCNTTINIVAPTTTTPSITILSPVAGQVLTTGTQVQIKWNTTGIPSNQNLQLALDIGSSGDGKVIADNVPNTGSYTWTVTGLQPYYSTETVPPTLISPTGQYNIGIADLSTTSNGTYAFNPNFGQSGVFTIVSPSAAPTNTISVTPSPFAITVNQGQYYSQSNVALTGSGSSQISWRVVGGALPPGMTYANGATTFLLLGTPSQVGTYNVTIQARDFYGVQASTNVSGTITVVAPVTVIPPSLPVLQRSQTTTATSGAVTLTTFIPSSVATVGASLTVTSVASGGNFTQHGIEYCYSLSACTAGNDGSHGWQNAGASNPPTAGTDSLSIPITFPTAGAFLIHSYESADGGATYLYTNPVTVVVSAPNVSANNGSTLTASVIQGLLQAIGNSLLHTAAN